MEKRLLLNAPTHQKTLTLVPLIFEARLDISVMYSLMLPSSLYFIETRFANCVFVLDSSFIYLFFYEMLFKFCKEHFDIIFIRHSVSKYLWNCVFHDHKTRAIWALALFPAPPFIKRTKIYNITWSFNLEIKVYIHAIKNHHNTSFLNFKVCTIQKFIACALKLFLKLKLKLI